MSRAKIGEGGRGVNGWNARSKLLAMDVILTIPTDEHLRAALQERAELQGKTVAELAREILREAVVERPLGERVGHLRGQLGQEASPPDVWRSQLKERNWRP